jgi:hypothetical protein
MRILIWIVLFCLEFEKSSYAFEIYQMMKSQGLEMSEQTFKHLLKICYVFNHTDKLIPLWNELKALNFKEVSRLSYFYLLQGLSKLALRDANSKEKLLHLLNGLNEDIENIDDLKDERILSSIAKVLYASVSLNAAEQYIDTTFRKFNVSATCRTQKALFKIACQKLDEKEMDLIWKKSPVEISPENLDMWSWRLIAFGNLYRLDRALDTLEGLDAGFRSNLDSKILRDLRVRFEEVKDIQALARFSRLLGSGKSDLRVS